MRGVGEEEDDEDVDNINEETSNSENNSDTSSEEDNAFLISSSRESVDEEGTSVHNDENDEGKDGEEEEEEEEEKCISSDSVKIETDSTSQSEIIVSMPIKVVDSASVPTLLNDEENKEEEIVDKHYLHKSEVAF